MWQILGIIVFAVSLLKMAEIIGFVLKGYAKSGFDRLVCLSYSFYFFNALIVGLSMVFPP